MTLKDSRQDEVIGHIKFSEQSEVNDMIDNPSINICIIEALDDSSRAYISSAVVRIRICISTDESI